MKKLGKELVIALVLLFILAGCQSNSKETTKEVKTEHKETGVQIKAKEKLAANDKKLEKFNMEPVQNNKTDEEKAKFVDEANYVDINGIPQFIYEVGENPDKPVILHLHGGPGLPFSNRAWLVDYLKDDNTMVYWDQRGAGKTALKNPESVPSFDIMEKDIDQVIEYLKTKYNVDKVGIFAHSWGTVIGSIYANEHPENVAFYIGVGQVIEPVEDERIGYEEALKRAEESGNQELVDQLNSIGDYPGEVASEVLPKMLVVRDAQLKLGMASTNPKAAEEARQSPLYIPEDENARDISVKLNGGLYEQMMTYSLYNYPKKYETPFYLILGRNDWQVPAVQGADYIESIKAPDKKLIWIEDATHSPMTEQPEAFKKAFDEVVSQAVK